MSLGAQKNFDRFMQSLRDRFLADWLPDETYYRQLIAKAILFKAIDRIVRREGFPAYQANIKTYLMAYVTFRSGSQLDLDTIWNEQAISDELTELLRSWSHGINSAIIETAGSRNVTEANTVVSSAWPAARSVATAAVISLASSGSSGCVAPAAPVEVRSKMSSAASGDCSPERCRSIVTTS